MDLLGRQVGGGGSPRLVGVPGLAVGQIAHGDRLAGGRQVGIGEVALQLAEGRRHPLLERPHRLALQPLPVGGGDRLGKLLEGLEHRALHRIVTEQALDLGGDVAQGHPRRRDPLLEAAVEQRDRLVDDGGDAAHAGDDVLVVLDAARRHDRQQLRDVLLRPPDLVDQQVLAVELLPFDRLLDVMERQIVVDLLGGGEPRAVDRRQRLLEPRVEAPAELDRFGREVGPAVVEAGKADEGGVLGRGVHLELPEEIEQLAQPLALAPLPLGGWEALEGPGVLGDVRRHGGIRDVGGAGGQQENRDGRDQLFHLWAPLGRRRGKGTDNILRDGRRKVAIQKLFSWACSTLRVGRFVFAGEGLVPSLAPEGRNLSSLGCQPQVTPAQTQPNPAGVADRVGIGHPYRVWISGAFPPGVDTPGWINSAPPGRGRGQAPPLP